jgi:hypothetical protein
MDFEPVTRIICYAYAYANLGGLLCTSVNSTVRNRAILSRLVNAGERQ